MEQNNDIAIIFSQKSQANLLDIFKKYNLEENDEEWIKKLNEGAPKNIDTVVDLVRKFSEKEITEKDFETSLRKGLNLDEQTAKKVLTDITTYVVPFLRKLPVQNIEAGILPKEMIDEEDPDSNKLIAKPQPSVNFLPPTETKKIITGPIPKMDTTKTDVPKRRPKKAPVATEEMAKPVQAPPPQQSGPDTYREPIE